MSSSKLLPKVSMTRRREALDGAELDEINDNLLDNLVRSQKQ